MKWIVGTKKPCRIKTGNNKNKKMIRWFQCQIATMTVYCWHLFMHRELEIFISEWSGIIKANVPFCFLLFISFVEWEFLFLTLPVANCNCFCALMKSFEEKENRTNCSVDNDWIRWKHRISWQRGKSSSQIRFSSCDFYYSQ